MKYTFQHFLDISTSAAGLQIIKVKAGGEYVRDRCKHLFSTYKYYKLGKISAKLIPASTLPVSPSGLAYNPGDEWQVDPRDQLSPGLVRITNGEDIVEDLSFLNAGTIRQMYTNTMLDPRWSKFMLQSGFSRSAIPLYWNVGNLKQAVYPDAYRNLPKTMTSLDGQSLLEGTVGDEEVVTNGGKYNSWPDGSRPEGLFQTGHRGKLDWMPTDAYENLVSVTASDKDGNSTEHWNQIPMLMPIPTIDCITIILPQAYKTLYYYRLFITETVYFRGVKNVGIANDSMFEYRAFDNFTIARYPYPEHPAYPWDIQTYDPSRPAVKNDGRGPL